MMIAVANACGTFALLHALANCGIELRQSSARAWPSRHPRDATLAMLTRLTARDRRGPVDQALLAMPGQGQSQHSGQAVSYLARARS